MAAATRAKKRLGTFLQELRSRAGKTLAHAADEVTTTISTVSRYETGEVFPAWPTIQTLLRCYGANPEQRELAAQLWEAARDEPDPLDLHAVIDEAVVRREIGGPDVMREQLAHLLAVGARPNVTVQVIRFDAGGYGTMSGPWVVLHYPEPDAVPGVYFEHPGGGTWVDDEAVVQRFATMFNDAAHAALTPADTADFLRDRMTALTER